MVGMFPRQIIFQGDKDTVIKTLGILLMTLLLILPASDAPAARDGFVSEGIVLGQGTSGTPFYIVPPGDLAQPERTVTTDSGEPAAFSLTLPDSAVPFGDNPVSVSLPSAGRVTIEVRSLVSTVIPENALTDYSASAGTFTFSWPALVWNREPLPRGEAALTCTFTPDGGEPVTWSGTTQIAVPRAVLLYALPEADAWYPGSKQCFYTDIALAAGGKALVEVLRNDEARTAVYSGEISSTGCVNTVCKWNGTSDRGQEVLPGEYILRVAAAAAADEAAEHPLTILAAPEEDPPLCLNDPYQFPPAGGTEAVWDFLTSPVWVPVGYEGNGLHVFSAPDKHSAEVGVITCATVAVSVLDLSVDGWVRIGCYRNKDAAYTEGWVPREALRYQRVNGHIALVIDKASQRLTVWADGTPLGTVRISTGDPVSSGKPLGETQAGVYLTGTRLEGFSTDGYRFSSVIRFESSNLLHSIGFTRTDGYPMDYSDHAAELGTKASHGCIRVDVQADGENNGINIWWIWTHVQRNTKVFIIEGN